MNTPGGGITDLLGGSEDDQYFSQRSIKIKQVWTNMKTMHALYTRCIKQGVEILTKPYFLRLVKTAYMCRLSPEHEKIMAMARKWYGVEKVSAPGRILSRWFMDFVVQAQFDAFDSKTLKSFELGAAEIGVGDLRIHCSTGDSNSSNVYLLGFSDHLTFFRIYRIFALPDSVAVDVGANLGIHTLALSECVLRGTVFSFEPRRSVYARLIDNLNENGIMNVVASDSALGDSIRESHLHVDENDFNIGKAHMDEGGNQIADMTTLDDALKESSAAVSLIKIDTEGYELQVLRGAGRVLTDHRPVLICEYFPSAYSFCQLKDLIPYPAHYFRIPYNQYEKLEPMQDGTNNPCDVLIVPEEKLTHAVWDKLGSL